MQALELMKTHVVKVTPDASLSEAVDLMDLYQVSGLPVVDTEGCLCGMLTESDILKAVVLPASPDTHPIEKEEFSTILLNPEAGNWSVRQVMTQPAVSVKETEDVRQAAQKMLAHHLKRIPVITEQNIVIGTLNRIDIFQALFEGTLDFSNSPIDR